MGGFSTIADLVIDGADLVVSQHGSGVVTWLLAGLFAMAGVAKLRHPEIAADSAVAFGIGHEPSPHLGLAIGGGELLLATGLVATPRLAAALASVALWGFTLLIGRALIAGQHFACYCFGESGAQISRWGMARTAGLALLATNMAWMDSTTFLRAPNASAALEAASAAAVLGIAWLASHLLLLYRGNPLGPRGRAGT